MTLQRRRGLFCVCFTFCTCALKHLEVVAYIFICETNVNKYPKPSFACMCLYCNYSKEKPKHTFVGGHWGIANFQVGAQKSVSPLFR